MDYRKEIKDLIKYLNEQAKENRQLAETRELAYYRGLNHGNAGAFELCAKWLHEILEGNQ